MATFSSAQERIPPRGRVLDELPQIACKRTGWRSRQTFIKTAMLEGIPGIKSIRIAEAKRLRSEQSRFPVCIEVPDLQGETEEEILAAFRELEASIEVYQASQVSRPPVDGPDIQKDLRGAEEMKSVEWRLQRRIDIKTAKELDARLIPEITDTGSKRMLLVVWIDGLERGDRRFMHLKLRFPDVPHPQQKGFDTISTMDDSTVENLDKIYNLQSLIEQLSDGLTVKGNSTSSGLFLYR